MEEAFSYKLPIKLHKTPPKRVFKFGLPRCDSDHLPSYANILRGVDARDQALRLSAAKPL